MYLYVGVETALLLLAVREGRKVSGEGKNVLPKRSRIGGSVGRSLPRRVSSSEDVRRMM